MTLLTEHLEAGWREVESGLFGRWVAEKFHSLPGASSSVIRVEAESSRKLQDAVSLREAQLTGTSEPIKDTITNDGTLVTGPQHESLRTEGVVVAGAEQIAEPVPNADEATLESGKDASEAQVDAPQVPADAADLTRLEESSAPAGADTSEAPASQSTQSDEDAASLANFENEGGANPTAPPATEDSGASSQTSESQPDASTETSSASGESSSQESGQDATLSSPESPADETPAVEGDASPGDPNAAGDASGDTPGAADDLAA